MLFIYNFNIKLILGGGKMKEELRKRLLEELGEEYADEIEYMLKNIINFYKENYFLHLQLVKELKKRNELQKQIDENNLSEFIITERKNSYKRNPVFASLDRSNKEIMRLSKTLNKTKKKKEDNDNSYFIDFDTADELELALELLLGLQQWDAFCTHKNVDTDAITLNQIENETWYINHLQQNPLFNQNELNWNYHFEIFDEIIKKYQKN